MVGIKKEEKDERGQSVLTKLFSSVKYFFFLISELFYSPVDSDQDAPESLIKKEKKKHALHVILQLNIMHFIAVCVQALWCTRWW